MRRYLALVLLFIPAIGLAQYDTMWTRQVARPVSTSYFNYATDMCADAAGNVYACGMLQMTGNVNALSLAKYGPYGDSLWVVQQGAVANGASTAHAVALDAAGNIYVVGQLEQPTTALNAVLLKYRSNGTYVGGKTLAWNGDDALFDVVVAPDGAVYACGARWNNTLALSEYLVVKFDTTTFDTVWTRGYYLSAKVDRARRMGRQVIDRYPDFYDDWADWENCAFALAVMPAGDVAVTGFGYDDVTYDEEMWTMRFQPGGTRVWQKTYHCAAADSFLYPDYAYPDVAFDIAVASDNNIYIAGFDYLYYDDGEGYDSDYNFAVVCYSSTGIRLNSQSVDEGIEDEDCATSIVLDNASPQNVYVTGWVTYNTGLRMTTHKFSHDLVTRHWGLRGGRYAFDSYGYDIFYSGNRVYVTGCVGYGLVQNLAVACFTDGNATLKDTLWTYVYSHPDSQADVGTAIWVLDSNNIYVAGQSNRDPVGGRSYSSMMLGRLLYARRDVAVTSILAPAGVRSFGTVDTPRAVVRNNGNTPTRFSARFTVSDGYTSTVSPVLAIGATDTIAFAAWTADSSGMFQTRCTVAVARDTGQSNNTVAGTVGVLPAAPVAQSPADGETLATRMPTLVVNPVTLGAADRYQFRVWQADSLVSQDTNAANLWVVPRDLYNGRAYTWDCRAHSAAGWGPYFSPRWTFYVFETGFDIGVARIVRPAGVVKNYGTKDATAPVWFRVEPRPTRARGKAVPVTVAAAVPAGAVDQTYEDSVWVTIRSAESLVVDFASWIPTTPDTYDLVSFTQLVGDTNSHNDTARGSVSVRRPVRDAGAVAVLVPTGQIDQGTAVVPLATVRNYGDLPLTSLVVRFKIGSFYIRDRTINLAVGQLDTVDFPSWTADSLGLHAVRCSTLLVGDNNPANDLARDSVRVVPPQAVEEPAGLPKLFALESALPNPFTGETRIAFALPVETQASVLVYDAAGNLVRTVCTGTKAPGRYTVAWDGRSASGVKAGPGIYYCRLEAGDYRSTVKLVRLD